MISSVIFMYVLEHHSSCTAIIKCYPIYVSIYSWRKLYFKQKNTFCGLRESRVRQEVFIGHDSLLASETVIPSSPRLTLHTPPSPPVNPSLFKITYSKTSTYSHNNATFDHLSTGKNEVSLRSLFTNIKHASKTTEIQ